MTKIDFDVVLSEVEQADENKLGYLELWQFIGVACRALWKMNIDPKEYGSITSIINDSDELELDGSRVYYRSKYIIDG